MALYYKLQFFDDMGLRCQREIDNITAKKLQGIKEKNAYNFSIFFFCSSLGGGGTYDAASMIAFLRKKHTSDS